MIGFYSYKHQGYFLHVDTEVKKWERVDTLINNAGLMPLSYLKNCKVKEWEQMIDINIKGVFYCTSAVIPYVRDKSQDI
jgi:NADP-dependent 3-hydroxy acid dehydrogenase YdfG